jgi:drug/metabolite transporter (DMT)-like permease/uncharacterized membrane protein YfcA
MAVAGFPAAEMRPTALLLNVVAAGYATWRLHRAGAIDRSLLRPLLLPSLPAAFLGGLVVLGGGAYLALTGMLLLLAAGLMAFRRTADRGSPRPFGVLPATLAGAGAGFLSGLTGIGGGIFLAPLLIAMNWTRPRQAASLSAPFILLNSVLGLAGVLLAGQGPAPGAALYVAGALAGAVGARRGLRWMSEPATRRVLAAILCGGRPAAVPLSRGLDRPTSTRWCRPHMDAPPPGSGAHQSFFLLALAALRSGNHVGRRRGRCRPMPIDPLGDPADLFVLARSHLAGDWPIPGRPAILGLGLGGGAVFSAMQYVGLQYTTALNVSVLNSLAPVMIVAAGAALFRERLSGRQLAGIGLSLAGVLVIVTKADLGTLTLLAFDVGDLIIFGNMMIWAIYSVCLRFAPRIHWLTFAFVLALVSALGTLPAMVWEHASGYRLQGNLETVLAVVYVAIFPSVVGYAAWNRGVTAIGAGRAGAFLYIIPLYSAVLASVFLGERLMAFHVAGFAAIVAGVTLAARRGG